MLLDQIAAAVGAAAEPVKVKLGKVTVRVLPQLDWTYDSLEAIQRGDFKAWAAGALVNDAKTTAAGKTTGSNDGALFAAANPTVRELIQFLSDYEAAAGISLGK